LGERASYFNSICCQFPQLPAQRRLILDGTRIRREIHGYFAGFSGIDLRIGDSPMISREDFGPALLVFLAPDITYRKTSHIENVFFTSGMLISQQPEREGRISRTLKFELSLVS
jgi:hypothetical protein